jgi:hypothetical protein
LYDYQTNVASYASWQEWLKRHHPPLLVLWGKYDPSFALPGAEAYKRDVAYAEVHMLDGGHFALDEAVDEAATRAVTQRRPKRSAAWLLQWYAKPLRQPQQRQAPRALTEGSATIWTAASAIPSNLRAPLPSQARGFLQPVFCCPVLGRR